MAGDVCIKGVTSLDFEPYKFTCCHADAQPTNSIPSDSPTILSPSASLYHPNSSSIHSTDPNSSARIIVKGNKPVVAGLGIALAIAILIAISLGILAAILMW